MKNLLLALLFLPMLAFGQGATLPWTPSTVFPGVFVTGDMVLPGTYTQGMLGQNIFSWNGAITGSENNAEYAPLHVRMKAGAFTNSFASTLVAAGKFETNVNDPAAIGAFGGIFASTNVVNSGNTAQGHGYVAGTFIAQSGVNDHGTGSGSNAAGALFGLNPNVRLNSGATFWHQLIGEEIDIAVMTGASVNDKIGMQIIQASNDAVAGSRINQGLTFTNTGSSGWDQGISFGTYSGNWPMAAGGTLIGCFPHAGSGACGTTTNGIDLTNITFTGSSYKSTGYSVDGSGNISAASITTTSGMNPTDIQIFTSTGANTWNKPSGTPKTITVIIQGGGGGGGGGARQVSGTAVSGGGGGGGGAYIEQVFQPSLFGSTVTCTVGAGGTAGTAAAADNSAGGTGGVGGTTSFGNFLSAAGGGGGQGGALNAVSGGGGGGLYSSVNAGGVTAGSSGSGGTGGSSGSNTAGLGGSATGGSGAGPTANTIWGQGSGGGGSSLAASFTGGPNFHGAGGGGSGGGVTATPTAFGGGAGGRALGFGTAPAGGGTGSNGSQSVVEDTILPGGGGSGGGGNTSGTAGTGGGGIQGSGGGGGGSNLNTFTAGTGGAGGNGFCEVITRY